MPRIPDFILDSVMYLYANEDDARSGKAAGGTCFLVGVKSLVPNADGDFGYFPYVVTNRHVVLSGHYVVRINTITDSIDLIVIEPERWAYPDPEIKESADLAVAPIEIDPTIHRIGYWPSERFLTKEKMKDFDMGLGHDVFSVSRFVNHEGLQRNLPIVRWGSVAMLPYEPILMWTGHLQKAFLVEMRSISGHSGAPVFLDDYDMWLDRDYGSNRLPTEHAGRLLLGVNSGHIPVKERDVLRDKLGNSMGYDVMANSGISVVIPAWKIQELLEMEEFVKQRAEEDTKHKHDQKGN